MAETNGARSSQTAPRDPEQIERDIARTRAELAATVAAAAGAALLVAAALTIWLFRR